MVPLITAESPEAFEAAYDEFIDNMVKLGDWRSIYNAKHQRWVEWMEANDYDDRGDLDDGDTAAAVEGGDGAGSHRGLASSAAAHRRRHLTTEAGDQSA